VEGGKNIKSQRQSAVKKAWKQEKEIIESTGNGSRKWNGVEKQEIQETGKAQGYEGHHINNVKDHPNQAGNPANVEFVTRKEHLNVHQGNFKNKTTGEFKNREVKR